MKRLRKRTTRRVAICVSLMHAAERDFLSGVFRHLDLGYSWKLQIIQSSPPFSAETLRQAESDGLDGIIISDARPQDMIPELVTTPIALAVISGVAFQKNHPLIRRVQPTVAIHNDNRAISESAVRHLASCGKFNSFGFVPAERGIVWSDERQEGFVNALAARGIAVRVFDAATTDIPSWLASLPKPAAVMAAYDELAVDVLAACETAAIRIPSQVAVIGVDNDEFVCRHSIPPLSSVLPGHEEMGYRAAAELERLMALQKPEKCPRHVTVSPGKVAMRESTGRISPAAFLVDRIKAQIRADATDGAKVDDIVRKLGVSRRLAELRFREIESKTISSALADRRLEEALRLIRTTKRTFVQIAAECGFSDAKHLTHRFSDVFGMSPREFRRKNLGKKP